MDGRSKRWLGLYVIVGGAWLAFLVVLGTPDPHALVPLFRESGPVESLSALAALAAAVVSGWLAYDRWTEGRPWKRWVLVALVAAFIGGEELNWGRIPLFGHVSAEDPRGVSVHAAGGHLLRDLLLPGSGRPLRIVILLAIGLSGGVLLARAVPAARHRLPGQLRAVTGSGPAAFLVIGVGLIVSGNLFDLVHEVGLPYFKGQWALEESAEMFGSLAFFLAASLAACHRGARGERAPRR
jgi:hypothetical protein